ncbi:hypothetical protein [uncultured Nitrospira sp.]|uniref:hypothetical protein n=1 Tax=uncultured Nitrospira sp. TaxID=157176 RepID=UPI00314052B5
MTDKQIKIKDPDLAKVGVALKRAAANARQLGLDTNTPVYVFRNGKIVDIVAEHRATRSPKKTTANRPQRKTTAPHQKAQSKKTR